MTQALIAPSVVLVADLGRRGGAHADLIARIRGAGVSVLLVDVGLEGCGDARPDVTRGKVARAAGCEHTALRAGDHRHAVRMMTRGARLVLARLYRDGRLQCTTALSGPEDTSVAAGALARLPTEVPRLLVSHLEAAGSPGGVAHAPALAAVAQTVATMAWKGVHGLSAPPPAAHRHTGRTARDAHLPRHRDALAGVRSSMRRCRGADRR